VSEGPQRKAREWRCGGQELYCHLLKLIVGSCNRNLIVTLTCQSQSAPREQETSTPVNRYD